MFEQIYNKVLFIKTGDLNNLDKITEMKSDSFEEHEKIEIKNKVKQVASLYKLNHVFNTHCSNDYNTMHDMFLNNIKKSTSTYFNNTCEIGLYPINEQENYIIIKDGEERSEFKLR